MVEIEWERVPGAKQYQLELYHLKTKKKITEFQSSGPLFKLNVRMGKYLFKSRIIDENNNPSPWSEFEELVIGPPPLSMDLPKDVLTPKNNQLSLDVSWNIKSPKGLKGWRQLVKNQKGEVVSEDFLKGEGLISVKQRFLPGEYQVTLVPQLPDGEWGDEQNFNFKVGSASLNKGSLALDAAKESLVVDKNNELDGIVTEYRIFYRGLGGRDWQVSRSGVVDSSGRIEYASWPPGEYRAEVKNKRAGFMDSINAEMSWIKKPTLKDMNDISLALDGMAKEITDQQKMKNP